MAIISYKTTPQFVCCCSQKKEIKNLCKSKTFQSMSKLNRYQLLKNGCHSALIKYYTVLNGQVSSTLFHLSKLQNIQQLKFCFHPLKAPPTAQLWKFCVTTRTITFNRPDISLRANVRRCYGLKKLSLCIISEVSYQKLSFSPSHKNN